MTQKKINFHPQGSEDPKEHQEKDPLPSGALKGLKVWGEVAVPIADHLEVRDKRFGISIRVHQCASVVEKEGKPLMHRMHTEMNRCILCIRAVSPSSWQILLFLFGQDKGNAGDKRQ